MIGKDWKAKVFSEQQELKQLQLRRFAGLTAAD
jgi:hypothetical protein